jgi:DNA-binding Xre family transcriptional regulator
MTTEETQHPLARVRAQRKLTQKQLAAKAGIHAITIAKIEMGTAGVTRVETWVALAEALRVQPYRIVDPASPYYDLFLKRKRRAS